MNVNGSWACASNARGRQNPNFTRIFERGSSRCLQSRRVAIFIFVKNIERSSKERPHVVVIVWAPENQFWEETDQQPFDWNIYILHLLQLPTKTTCCLFCYDYLSILCMPIAQSPQSGWAQRNSVLLQEMDSLSSLIFQLPQMEYFMCKYLDILAPASRIFKYCQKCQRFQGEYIPRCTLYNKKNMIFQLTVSELYTFKFIYFSSHKRKLRVNCLDILAPTG